MRAPGWDQLPEEVITRILSHVEPIDLCRLQRVNRQWQRLCNDRDLYLGVARTELRIPNEQLFNAIAFRRAVREVRELRDMLWYADDHSFAMCGVTVVQLVSLVTRPTWNSIIQERLAQCAENHPLGPAIIFYMDEDWIPLELLTPLFADPIPQDRVRAWVNYRHPSTDRCPIHGAVYSDNVPLARWLLEKGADVEAKDPGYEQTPFLIAVQRAGVEMLQLLIEFGANPRTRDRDRMGALSLCRQRANLDYCLQLFPQQ